MRSKLLYLRLAIFSLVISVAIGFLFPKKSYFVVREDNIKVEIGKTRYFAILEINPKTHTLLKEESFHMNLSITFLPLIFGFGVFLLQFIGPNVPRKVNESLQYPKNRKENILENLHGNDGRLI